MCVSLCSDNQEGRAVARRKDSRSPKRVWNLVPAQQLGGLGPDLNHRCHTSVMRITAPPWKARRDSTALPVTSSAPGLSPRWWSVTLNCYHHYRPSSISQDGSGLTANPVRGSHPQEGPEEEQMGGVYHLNTLPHQEKLHTLESIFFLILSSDAHKPNAHWFQSRTLLWTPAWRKPWIQGLGIQVSVPCIQGEHVLVLTSPVCWLTFPAVGNFTVGLPASWGASSELSKSSLYYLIKMKTPYAIT